MKEGKAPGIDETQTELIKHRGNATQKWMLKFFSTNTVEQRKS